MHDVYHAGKDDGARAAVEDSGLRLSTASYPVERSKQKHVQQVKRGKQRTQRQNLLTDNIRQWRQRAIQGQGQGSRG